MRSLISGILGLAFGGFILVGMILKGGPQGEGGYYIGQIIALIMGVLLLVGGLVYLVLGIRELNPQRPKRKRRKRRARNDEVDAD